MNPVLQAHKLTKSFLLNGKAQVILQDASLSLAEGEFLSIIGASGCGKSTYLELLAGVTKPDKGSVIYRGQEVTGKGGFLGYMPQEDLLFPWLSVQENALLPARAKGQDLVRARKRIDELLPVFGLEEHSGHLPWQLSGGLKQRTALLRTCMTEASLLLLDEPLASLDALTRKQMQVWLKNISIALGLSVILVTHDVSEALELSDRLLIMKGTPGRFDREWSIPDSIRTDIQARDRLITTLHDALGLHPFNQRIL